MNGRRMRGLYTVEFAIVGLLLFILLFSVIELGRLYFTVNTLNETVRRGARLVLRGCAARCAARLRQGCGTRAGGAGGRDRLC